MRSLQFPGGGQAGTARATGTVNAASSWSFLGPVSLKAHAQHVDLATVIKPYVTRGLLQADVAHRWENRGKDGIAFKGNGSWKAEIKELMLERLPVGAVTIPSLNVHPGHGDLELPRCRLRRHRFQGRRTGWDHHRPGSSAAAATASIERLGAYGHSGARCRMGAEGGNIADSSPSPRDPSDTETCRIGRKSQANPVVYEVR